jgi:hypothetical protein
MNGTVKLTATLAAALLLCAAAAAARADVKIRMTDTATPAYEETLYLKGSSQRREFRGTGRDGRPTAWAYLDDCARQQFTWLDLINRRYSVLTGGVPAATVAAFNEPQFPPPSAKLRGTMFEVVNVTDTGERREMFSFKARRLKTLVTWRVEPDSCDAGQVRIEIDGWYVDLLHGVDCSPDLSGALPRMEVDLSGSRCLNRRFWTRKYFYRREYTGEARLGFPVAETTRAYDERGAFREHRREVLELSTAPLDDALFSAPAGYERVEPRYVGKPSVLSRALSIFR